MKLSCLCGIVGLLLTFCGQSDARDIFGLKKLDLRIVDQLNNSIDGARGAALALEQQASADGEARIKQVDTLVKAAIDKLNDDIEHQDTIAKDFINQFDRMKDDTMVKLSDIIDTIFCKINIAMTQQMSDALGSFGKMLGTEQIEITPPVLYLGETTFMGNEITKKFRIKTPFSATYSDIRKYLIDTRLAAMRDDTPISSILQTYILMARLSERAGCLVGDQKGYGVEYALYWAKIGRWKRLAGEGITIP